jgi:4-hydroxy-tetrahydrodipicolinate synthase
MRDASLGAAWQHLEARRPHGIAASLLPYTATGEIDWPAFEQHVARTHAAGLDVAVNMDTGFGDLLSPAERQAVLDATQRVLGEGSVFYAGAYPTGGARPADWHGAVDEIVRRGARPVIVQSRAMHGMDPARKGAFYADILAAAPEGALAFELSPRFAPHGEIWDDATFDVMLGLDRLLGSKHSSLERRTELRRLAARDRARPEYRLYTGNDLAIDLVAFGSDYLLGLATFAPDRFGERDSALAAGDASFLERNDGLQHLGNVGFREPIPAYKHAAAQFLHLTGQLPGEAIHPRAARRPGSDRVLLFDCARRLDLLDDPERIWSERVEPFLSSSSR